MQIECWNIHGNGFHFGLHGLGQEETGVTMPSDSLFAALVARLIALEGTQAAEAFVSQFLNEEPPFVLSSTFPFAGKVRFFPLPTRSLYHETDTVRSKDLKRTKYVSESLFRTLLDGGSLARVYPGTAKIQGSQVLVSQEEIDHLPTEVREGTMPLWSIEQRPRVTLGRSAQNSTIFFTGRVAFGNGCGLWFGVRWLKNDSGLKSKVSNLLAELGDSGLGGERSAGFGACQIRLVETIELPDAGSKLWVNLSRYIPRQDETSALQDPAAAFNLKNVGGWAYSPANKAQRRRNVNLLAEGSVLGVLDRQVPGQIVDVRPRYKANPDPFGHPVYRSGLALAVGMKGGGK